MSYRPDEQSIETPCRKIIQGINEFSAATSERIKSDEWKADHIKELNALRVRLMNLLGELETLAESTW